MYASSIFVFAFLAFSRVALATPPACLLAAMGVQPNPADLKAICGTLEPMVAGNITAKCTGDAEASAISMYSATCLSAESVTISINTASATSPSVSAKTTLVTASGTGASKTTGTATGTSAAATGTATNSAGSNTPHFVMALFAAGLAGHYIL